jgi:hypothetical protein
MFVLHWLIGLIVLGAGSFNVAMGLPALFKVFHLNSRSSQHREITGIFTCYEIK